LEWLLSRSNGSCGWGNQDPFNIITNRFDNFDIPFSAGMFGGTGGAQMQMDRVVLGIEADIDWASIKGSSTISPTALGVPLASTFNTTTDITSVTTARARVGTLRTIFFITSPEELRCLVLKLILPRLRGLLAALLGLLTAPAPMVGPIAFRENWITWELMHCL
jgi:hypothetical protein